MFAVTVKPSRRRAICTGKAVWVRDAGHPFYVTESERGLFATRAEAEAAITERHEIIVEVPDASKADFRR